jgi:hypothetical protein
MLERGLDGLIFELEVDEEEKEEKLEDSSRQIPRHWRVQNTNYGAPQYKISPNPLS